MNKMLFAVFDNEIAAQAGLQALHKLHSQGDITVYDTGVLAKDGQGVVTVRVTAVNDLPVANADVHSVNEDSGAAVVDVPLGLPPMCARALMA